MITRRALAGLLAMLMPAQKAAAATVLNGSGSGGTGLGSATVTVETMEAGAIVYRPLSGGYFITRGGQPEIAHPTYVTAGGYPVTPWARLS